MMVTSFPAVELGKVYYRRCDNWKTRCLTENRGSYMAEISLPNECRTDSAWWEANILTCSAPVARDSARISLLSDASSFGWGGVRDDTKTGDLWTDGEKGYHINQLELLAAFYTLQSLGRDIRNSHVLIKLDNTTAVTYMNNMGGRKETCSEITRKIWEWCVAKGVWLHCPGNCSAYPWS